MEVVVKTTRVKEGPCGEEQDERQSQAGQQEEDSQSNVAGKQVHL